MKYFLCPQESIKCGGEDIVVVPTELTRESTKFFSKEDVCHYKLSPIGDQRNMFMNVTFDLLLNVDVYLMY